MTVKRIVIWLLIIFAVFFLITNPDGAATFLSHLFSGLKSAGKSLSTFVSNL